MWKWKEVQKCCARIQPSGEASPSSPVQKIAQDKKEDFDLLSHVTEVKEAATEKRPFVKTVGVMILFSTAAGDAWLLEVTEGDALQLSSQGEEIEVLIEQNPETAMVEWSHTFAVKKDTFIVTSYNDKSRQEFKDYPVKKITAAIKGIKKRIPASWSGDFQRPVEEEKG